MKSDRLTVFTKGLLDIMFICGIASEAAVPFLLRLIDPDGERYYVPVCVLLMAAGVFTVLILYELRRMFATVIADACFVRANVVSLKRMGTYAFVIAALAFICVVIRVTSGALVVTVVFLVAGLFSKVLAQVFSRAVAYKEENDLTV
jgi:hypothetical protein